MPPTHPTTLLCLEPDSGFRCLMTLLILNTLLLRLQRHLNLPATPPLAHIFDLVGGEGTGGIIALLAGRLNTTTTTSPTILSEMGSKFCPWGGTKRRHDGTHTGTPFPGGITTTAFERLDAELPTGGTYHSASCVKTVVFAGLKQPRVSRWERWTEKARFAVKVWPVKKYSSIRSGKYYSNRFFESSPPTTPVLGGEDPFLKERFRTYDATLARSNVFVSDVAHATMTHDRLVPEKTINGRVYGGKKKSAGVVRDVMDEGEILFPGREMGVVIRIGGEYISDFRTVREGRVGRGGEKGGRENVEVERGRTVLQITLPEVDHVKELWDDRERVVEVFTSWCRETEVEMLLEKCVMELAKTVGSRRKWVEEGL